MVGDDLREVVAITWPAQDDEQVRQVGPRLDAGDDDHRMSSSTGVPQGLSRIVRPSMDGTFRSTSFTTQTAA